MALNDFLDMFQRCADYEQSQGGASVTFRTHTSPALEEAFFYAVDEMVARGYDLTHKIVDYWGKDSDDKYFKTFEVKIRWANA